MPWMGSADSVPIHGVVEDKMEIRVARVADALRLLEIYAPYVRETAVTFECEVPTAEEFKRRIASVLEAYPYLVAVEDGRIVGYAYASSFHDRAAYMWSAEVSIYVDRAYHRMGIGRKLYQRLEELLKRQCVTNLNACIAYPNPSSIAFHEKEGYRLVGHFTQCGYKQGRWWDIVWMEKMIGCHTVPPKPWRPFQKV
mgnify:CR=1 FL=1